MTSCRKMTVALSSAGLVTSVHFEGLFYSTSSSQIKLQTQCITTCLSWLLWFVIFVHVPFSFHTFYISLLHVCLWAALCVVLLGWIFFLWSGASRLRYSKFLEAIGLLASSASIVLLLCRIWHLCNCLIARYVLISLTIGSWWTKFEIQGHAPPLGKFWNYN